MGKLRQRNMIKESTYRASRVASVRPSVQTPEPTTTKKKTNQTNKHLEELTRSTPESCFSYLGISTASTLTFQRSKLLSNHQKADREPRHWWLTRIILATQETEIRRIAVQNQTGQIVCKTLSQTYPSQKKTGGVAQGEGPESKPQYHKKINK
jgi:hypothetical protein